jgi:hypothetical protein
MRKLLFNSSLAPDCREAAIKKKLLGCGRSPLWMDAIGWMSLVGGLYNGGEVDGL